MCLWVRTALHPDYYPLVAEEDLLVVKGLIVYDEGWNIVKIDDYEPICLYKKWIYTPFMKKNVDFDGKGEYILREPCLHTTQDIYGTTVEYGIHSLSYHAFMDGRASLDVRHLDRGESIQYFNAIIPKGAKYYAGQDFDYASDELIIYKYGGEERIKNAKKTSY